MIESLQITSPWWGLLGAVAVGVAAWVGRRWLTWSVGWVLAVTGAVLLVAAGFGVVIDWRVPARAVVVVDETESTRGAWWRDQAVRDTALGRLGLRGQREMIVRNDGVAVPEDVDAVVLFSDGHLRWEGTVPPVLAVMDESRPLAADVRIGSLDHVGGRVFAAVHGSGDAAVEVVMSGGRDELARGDKARGDIARGDIARGEVRPGYLLAGRLGDEPVATVTAAVAGADTWPENDRLSLVVHRGAGGGRLVMDESVAPVVELGSLVGYRQVVVRRQVSPKEVQLLRSFAADMGGLVIVEAMAVEWEKGRWLPLTLRPQERVEWWVVLDSSGSMEPVWDQALEAARRLWQLLPADEQVTVASFAAGLNVWGGGKPESVGLPTRPAGVLASGPTNARSALEQIAAWPLAEGVSRRRIVLITDSQADGGGDWSGVLQTHDTLHVFSLGGAMDERATLAKLAQESGGSVTGIADSLERAVSSAAEELVAADIRAAEEVVVWSGSPDRFGRRLATVLATQAREGAEVLANGGGRPAVARWRVGMGVVVSSAMPLTGEELSWLLSADSGMRAVSDASITIANGGRTRITVAGLGSDGDPPVLVVGGERIEMTRTGAGVFAVEVEPRQEVRGAVVDCGGPGMIPLILPGRYPAEFDEIGVSREKLQELARGTRGAVVDANSPANVAKVLRSTGRLWRLELSPWLSGLAAMAGISAILLLSSAGRRAA